MKYSFYLYSMLVNDLIINVNDWSIPYDVSYDLILESYKNFIKTDTNVLISLHDAVYDYINDDETLYSELRERNENI
ncbi:MAG: hypothetical protein RR623_01070 [Bacilli bacterium]